MARPYHSFAVLFALAGLVLGADLSANLPENRTLRFEQEHDGGFIARGEGFWLAVNAQSHVLSWRTSGRTAVLRTNLRGARTEAQVTGLEPLAVRTNYLVGSAESWRTGVRSYARVQADDVYPGISLVFYGRAGALEYDFVVAPGADTSAIRFDVAGAEQKQVDAGGDLVLTTPAGAVRWHRPVLYQESGGTRQTVAGHFAIAEDGNIGFDIGRYDHSRRLIIDPVLNYATFLGASGDELARAIGVDGAGNVYVAGSSSSRNLAVTPGVVQTAYAGETFDDWTGDVFVAKYTTTGELAYLTYLGGNADDVALSLKADAAGSVYLTGYTNSNNFPVTSGVPQSGFGGRGGNGCFPLGDAFVAKLNPSGSQLIYSTFLGGSQDDAGTAITIDPDGNAYVAGLTRSANFPTTMGAFHTSFQGAGGQPGIPYCNGAPKLNTGDAFVAKLNPSGSEWIFSTFLGGTFDDGAYAIAVDAGANVYVAGGTVSTNFPTTIGVISRAFHGTDLQNEFGHIGGDAFVTKLSPAGSALVYSTLLGGIGDEVVSGIVVDGSGSAYVTGLTTSSDFPTTAMAVQRVYAGYINLPFLIETLLGDGFVSRLNPDGTALLYSTFLGGSANDYLHGIAVDSGGLIYVVGGAESTDFPVTSGAAQSSNKGGGGQEDYLDYGDGVLSIIDTSSRQLVYSTYLGGTRDDFFTGVALDQHGSLWVLGSSISSNFPVTGSAAQHSYGGSKTFTGIAGDAVLVKITDLPAVPAGPAILTDGNGVINGATFAPGDIVSGSWVSIKGSGFTDKTVDWSSFDFSSGQLPKILEGVQVLFNGQPGAMWYLIAGNPQQINVQAPANLDGPVDVKVVKDGVESNTVRSMAVQSAPGIFAYSPDNTTTLFPAAVFPDGIVVGDPAKTAGTRKVRAGDHVSLYVNSLAPSPAGVVSVSGATDPVTVKVGTMSVQADFSGLYGPGTFQVNFTVPALGVAGNYPIFVGIGAAMSQNGIVLPYQ